ncbi:diguanylate cyclase domain-containing protein [Marinospirillum sp.]|uniref:sensor domain-containing diguanylate cyclase n=1 Tax=Marinospirillum sp. TaxID=2183934 RepID=UPI00384C827E
MKRWMSSLHARLMLSLGLGWVLLVCALLGSSWYLGRDITRESILVQLEYQAEMLAKTIEQDVTTRTAAIRRVAGQLPDDLEQTAAVQAVLADNTALLAYFDGLVFADTEGRIRADWPRTAGREDLDVTGREFFQRAQGMQKAFVSEPFIGRVTSEPLVMIAQPLTDHQGEFQGMVGGVLRVLGDNFLGFLQRHRLGLQGFAGLATSSGRVLVHPDHELILQPLPDEFNSFIDKALLGWEGSGESHLLSGNPALQAYKQIWSADWVLGVYLPNQEAYAAFDRLWWILWSIGGLVIALTLPILWWLLWVLLLPVHRFTSQIESIHRGDQERIEAQSSLTELRSVAKRFNSLLYSQAQIRADLQRRQTYLNAVLDSTPSGVFVTDLEGQSIYVNSAYKRITGLDAPQLLGMKWLDGVHPEDQSALLKRRNEATAANRPYEVEYRYMTSDDRYIWLETHASPVTDEEDRVQGYIGTVRDITERKQQEEADRWAAEHDSLTQLLNRRGFDKAIQQALTAWQEKRQPAALLLIDLDHFKPVNDNLGHDAGDLWLVKIAQLLSNRAGEVGVAARQGGDEFALLLPGYDLKQAQQEAETIRQEVTRLDIPESREFKVTTSIGVAELEEEDGSAVSWIKRADEACYDAKAEGRNQVVVH